MPKIVPIVEGEGERKAVPALCYKILHEVERYDIFVAAPIAAKGAGNLTTEGGLEKFLDIARRVPDCSAVLVMMDADDTCALTLAKQLAARVSACRLNVPVCVVVAVREYEAWFLASLTTLRGQDVGGRYTLSEDLNYTDNAESRRGVKEWFNKALPEGMIYAPTVDQVAMTSLIDPVTARANSRSFRRMCHAIEQIVEAIDSGAVMVTP